MEDIEEEAVSELMMESTERDHLLPKSTHSDEELAEPPSPRDRYHVVYVIFYVLGIGSLLPWNFFSTAREYFVYKLRNTSIPAYNSTDNENNMQTMFESYLTVAAMVPNVLFMFLNTAATKIIPLRIRVIVSCVVMIVLFSVTLALARIDTDSWQNVFFISTIVTIVIMNAASAVFQGGIFGLAGMFPKQYTGSVMGGMGMGGTIAAIAYIAAIALGSDPLDTGFGYFLTAGLVVTVALIGYLCLPFFTFAVHHTAGPRQIRTISVNGSSNSSTTSDLNSNNSDPFLPNNEALVQIRHSPKPTLVVVFKQIWPYAFCVFFVFLVTLSCYPSVNSAIQSMYYTDHHPGPWAKDYFAAVSCFLVFNLSDLCGRTLAGLVSWPREGSPILPILCIARVVFVPIFMLCNVQPRHTLPVVFHHDAIPIVVMFLFGVSNGHLSTLSMMYGPRTVQLENVETAGSMMAFFLSLGLAGGSLFSLLLRDII